MHRSEPQQNAPSKTIVLVGHCGPDSSYLRIAVRKAVPDAQVLAADDQSTLNLHLKDEPALLLLNRVLDYGFSTESGIEVVSEIQRTHPHVKTMLVSNYPEAQTEAVAAGALPGFGKRELGT